MQPITETLTKRMLVATTAFVVLALAAVAFGLAHGSPTGTETAREQATAQRTADVQVRDDAFAARGGHARRVGAFQTDGVSQAHEVVPVDGRAF